LQRRRPPPRGHLPCRPLPRQHRDGPPPARVRRAGGRRRRPQGGRDVSDLADYGAYAELYDERSEGVRGDVEFYRDLALEAGGLVVEVGAGTGRMAIPMAEAGVEVVGIDLSREMLAVAGRKA